MFIPKTILSMTEKYINIVIDKKLLEQVNDVYSDARYPSNIGSIPTGKPSIISLLSRDVFRKCVIHAGTDASVF